MKRNTALLALVVTGLSLVPQPAAAQLFENLLANLRALSGARYAVNNPHNALTNLAGELVQGPKDIAVADLDGDAKPDFAASGKDGTVMLYFGVGDGSFSNVTYLRTWTDVPADLGGMSFTNYATNVFCDYQPTNFILVCYTNSPPPSLPNLPPPPTNVVCFTNFQYGCVGFVTNILTNVVVVEGPSGLRGLALADFTGDGRRDIAVASPGEGVIYLLANAGGRSFAPAIRLAAWLGVRDLAAGDFDGDGLTDLAAAGTTNGVAHFQSLGNGTFTLKTNLLQLASDPFNEDSDDYEFPQPAYYLRTVRQPGDSQDELIVSFAQRTKLWVLRANEQGQLAISGDLENVRLTALDAAPLLVPNTNGAPPDLITAYSRGGCLDIFAATNLSQRFSGRASSRYFVPGAPRNVRIADLDQDGWNDVVVVAQRSDRVLAYKNDQGRLVLASEAFTGRSPREMDLGDFNSDGRPDLAVLNRFSHDVSVFITSTNTPDANTPVGFLALDNAYPVDGGVSGLGLRDFNGDGRSDVLQLHRDTSEFSVRLTAPNGSLGEAVFYAITNGFQPSGQIAVDVNGDGLADMISANLSGSISVRLGEPGGTFGPEQTFSLSDDANGGLIT
ncbi:MAG TPA: VCBS repeat-containing protein, partial [Methylomirabilota bacterium]|nr:VCBS repeat-containing protein [Methylomirabilota bacterium]